MRVHCVCAREAWPSGSRALGAPANAKAPEFDAAAQVVEALRRAEAAFDTPAHDVQLGARLAPAALLQDGTSSSRLFRHFETGSFSPAFSKRCPERRSAELAPSLWA